MIRKLKCWLGWHDECDLWLFSGREHLLDKADEEALKEWGHWMKLSYDEFGGAYYLECKHCGKML